MREAPERIKRLPEQYFTALLARVAAAAARGDEPLIDLGRGNPETGPPEHVVRALSESAARPDVHGYAPFSGLPELKKAIAGRYRDVYGVNVDPTREVAVLPGTKTGLMEFALCAVERGGTIVLPDPGYPDYFSAVALAGAQHVSFSGFGGEADALYLNFPSNPTAACAPDGFFEEAIRRASPPKACSSIIVSPSLQAKVSARAAPAGLGSLWRSRTRHSSSVSTVSERPWPKRAGRFPQGLTL